MMMKIAFLFFSLCVASTTTGAATAQTPQFDGVYAQLEGGELVELRQLERTWAVLAGRGDDTDLNASPFFNVGGQSPFGFRPRPPVPQHMVCLMVPGVFRSAVQGIQQIDPRTVEAFVVRSPERHEMNGVTQLVSLEIVQASLRERQGTQPLPSPGQGNPLEAFNPVLTDLHSCHGRPGDDVNLRRDSPDLVRHAWGWWSFRTQTVDSLVTRFVPGERIAPDAQAPDFIGQAGKWPREGFAVEFIVGGERRYYFLGGASRQQSSSRMQQRQEERNFIACFHLTRQFTTMIEARECPPGYEKHSD